ncbi:hypothetical protein L7F22_004066 [Adiantum nelumboides]|nr:hypothetical protein [Adiantum nelumboides]
MTSNFWKGLFENLGTRLNFSLVYHPQTDGQSEIANLTILDLLKSYVTEVDQRSQWEKYLPLVEYAYNNTVHTSTGKAPFEVIEGRSKSPLLLKVHGKIFAADEYSRDLKESFQKIKEAISISQQKQKAAANKHRRALAFKENDWVLLKFPKARLRHTSGKNPTGHQKYYAKLAKRYYGPFQILKPINEMAYQLKLPNHWLIHNAFHVSILKPYKGEPPREAIMEDPPEVEDQEEVLLPECILRHEDKVLRHEARDPSLARLCCHLAVSSHIHSFSSPQTGHGARLAVVAFGSASFPHASKSWSAEVAKPLPFSRVISFPFSLCLSPSHSDGQVLSLQLSWCLLSMGLPGSADISTDVLPMLIINIAMSLGHIKHAFYSFMQVIGLLSAAPSSGEVLGAREYLDDHSFYSGLMLSALSCETRQALPRSVFKPDLHVGVQVDVDCPVCLQEIQKSQEVWVLPRCRHLFHRACLDRWLDQEQFTCPVCRRSLVPEEVCKKQQQREQEIAEELLLWFSSTHGAGLQGLWCYS